MTNDELRHLQQKIKEFPPRPTPAQVDECVHLTNKLLEELASRAAKVPRGTQAAIELQEIVEHLQPSNLGRAIDYLLRQ